MLVAILDQSSLILRCLKARLNFLTGKMHSWLTITPRYRLLTKLEGKVFIKIAPHSLGSPDFVFCSLSSKNFVKPYVQLISFLDASKNQQAIIVEKLP